MRQSKAKPGKVGWVGRWCEHLAPPTGWKPRYKETEAKGNAGVKAGGGYSVDQGFHNQDEVGRIDFC